MHALLCVSGCHITCDHCIADCQLLTIHKLYNVCFTSYTFIACIIALYISFALRTALMH